MLDQASHIAPLLAANASNVDVDNLFPVENLNILKEAGLMSAIIPKEFGGNGIGLKETIEIAKIIGGSCLSTGMIWAMHCQQLACVVNHTDNPFRETFLREIAEKNSFLGSVTTERGQGSILSSMSPLIYGENTVEVSRMAPIVTGGLNCDAYLITMQSDENASATDVKLVYAWRDQLEVSALKDTVDTMGMRGTNSIPLSFKGSVPQSQIMNKTFNFDVIAYETMIPVGHLVWASCWLGGATKALKEMIKIFRSPQNRNKYNLNSDLFLEKIARIRIDLGIVSAVINDTLISYEKHLSEDVSKLRSPGFLIKINNLKVISSETLFKAMNDLIEISGVYFGYIKNPENQLERVFRDLRSASLMINNDKLLVASGRLSLIDKSEI